jgi:hypothetical protein
MKTYFKVKAKFTRQTESGIFKRVSEDRLIEAESFTDAEATVYEELGAIIRGEFKITAMAIEDYFDLIFADVDSETFYNVKAKEAGESEGGKETKIDRRYLVQESTPEKAIAAVKELYKNTTLGFEVIASVKSTIVEVYLKQVEA